MLPIVPNVIVSIDRQSEDIQLKLIEIECEYKKKYLTEYGYYIKKFKLLKHHLEPSVLEEIRDLKFKLESCKISQEIFCENVKHLLITKSLNGNCKSHSLINGAFSALNSNGSGDSCTNGVANKRTITCVSFDPMNELTSSASKRKCINGASLKSDDIEKFNDEKNNLDSTNNDEGSLSDTSSLTTGTCNSDDIQDKPEFTANTDRTLFNDKKDSDCADNDEGSVSDMCTSNLDDGKVKPEIISNINRPLDAESSTDRNTENLKLCRSFVIKIPRIRPVRKASKHFARNSTENNSQFFKNDDGDDDDDTFKPNVKRKSKTKSPKTKERLDKCVICRQYLDNLLFYPGHPNEAECEDIVLTNPEFDIYSANYEENGTAEKISVKITKFSVYDERGHLCPVDEGLLEKNVKLYFSGYIKPVYDEVPEPTGGFAAKDLGPLIEWWVAGYDGGEKGLIGFSSEVADYYLMDPSDHYAPLFKELQEKILLSKWIIECLMENHEATYEDLMIKLQVKIRPHGMPEVSEEMLLKHARFICDQVDSLDAIEDDDEDDDKLMDTPCMQHLVGFAGVTSGKKKTIRRAGRETFNKSKAQIPRWTLATTTYLVQNTFETFFPHQLDKGSVPTFPTTAPIFRRKRCNVCAACQEPECGSCTACLDKPKYGGRGIQKQACINRRCTNMVIKGEDDGCSDEEDCEIINRSTCRKVNRNAIRNVRKIHKDICWKGDGISDMHKIYYPKVIIGSEEYSAGSYVFVEPDEPGMPSFIGQIRYMWEGKSGEKWFHSHWLYRGSETVLGETGDAQELFLTDQCADAELFSIRSSLSVTYKKTPSNWEMMGNCELTIFSSIGPDDGKTFFYQKRYDSKYARFEDPLDETEFHTEGAEHKFCVNCKLSENLKMYDTPITEGKIDNPENDKETLYEVVKWRGDEYRVGSCIFVNSDVLKLKNYTIVGPKETKKPEPIDEDMYPEKYRKAEINKAINNFAPEPFGIGYIVSIMTRSSSAFKTSEKLSLRIKKFYRPENIDKGNKCGADLNLLYWTNSECTIKFSDVTGKCYVLYDNNIDGSIDQWSKEGPYRFHFLEAYDPQMGDFYDVPPEATKLGYRGKGGNIKPKGGNISRRPIEIPIEWPHISHPLRTLDVFAGCGGLSEGLHQAKVSESLWAIELVHEAANAFKLNNPKATVFTDDCNYLLKMVISGKTENEKGQKLPMKGDVEMLCGGPPCQGFSGMNRFSNKEYSLFKNSLIVSYLSYCDYYRPRYFILENVRNFVSHKKSMILKLTMRCLIRMGYQCTFGILQAGNYGVPQTRKRVIIMAAAPGEILPKYPEPWHVFSNKAQSLTVNVDELRFTRTCNWIESAPYRMITVKDAMSDLPTIINGAEAEEISYGGPPLTSFQRTIRGEDCGGGVLRDHICKRMLPIIEKRISFIPKEAGADWRDLPNIVVQLSNGSFTKKLRYTHHHQKNGKSSTGELRGVCACASGRPCDPMDKQSDTLIPWCLPHTGNKYNHWTGLYGRLDWNGFFRTTITNPEPMGKQGLVLHPEEDRVVSVRECARSQGFPDTYRFYGSIMDKHRQIGNAVPPPMGKAIGLEIRTAINEMEIKNNSSKNSDDTCPAFSVICRKLTLPMLM